MSNYHKKMTIPIKIINKVGEGQETIRKGFIKLIPQKTIRLLLIFTVIFLSQIYLFSAFEAHVINVTAHICNYSETRTPGYWKTHEEITTPLLPYINWVECEDPIITFEQAFKILDYNAKDMRKKLMSHLLAMKLNVANFGIGEYFAETCEFNGKTFQINKTINELVTEADVLVCDEEATRKELEDAKNVLECLNNAHTLRYCANSPLRFDQFAFISNEVLLVTNEGELIEVIAPAAGEPMLIVPPTEEATGTEPTSTEATSTEETIIIENVEGTTTTEEATTTENSENPPEVPPETPEVPPEEPTPPPEEPTPPPEEPPAPPEEPPAPPEEPPAPPEEPPAPPEQPPAPPPEG